MFKYTFLSIVCLYVFSGCVFIPTTPPVSDQTSQAEFSTLQFESPDIHEGSILSDAQVSNTFGCTGANISPEFSWHDAPVGTKSFALTVYDPDAPTGSGWWHWIVYNIPSTVDRITAGSGAPESTLLPLGAIQAKNDAGERSYMGACPPVGDTPHHYIFTLYALKTDKIDLSPDASAAMVGFMIHSNTLAKTTLNAVYGQ